MTQTTFPIFVVAYYPDHTDITVGNSKYSIGKNGQPTAYNSGDSRETTLDLGAWRFTLRTLGYDPRITIEPRPFPRYSHRALDREILECLRGGGVTTPSEIANVLGFYSGVRHADSFDVRSAMWRMKEADGRVSLTDKGSRAAKRELQNR